MATGGAPHPGAAAAALLKQDRGWFRALGVSWIVLGVLSILVPMAAGLTVELIVALFLLLGGVAHGLHAFRVRPWPGAALALVWALLNVLAGAVLLARPAAGVLTLTVVLAAFLLAEGVAKSILAFRIRPDPSWRGFLLSGGLGVALGLLLWTGLPGTAGWAIDPPPPSERRPGRRAGGASIGWRERR
jgi:uncharacterized membrane protein HdeD (DUF308 family)